MTDGHQTQKQADLTSAKPANAWSWLILVVVIAEVILLLSFALQGGWHAQTKSPKGPARQQTSALKAGTHVRRLYPKLDELIWQNHFTQGQHFQRSETLGRRRPKHEIDVLVDESNALLEITRTGVPLFQEWQSLLTTNPERVCLGLDLEELSSTSARLAGDFRKAQTAQQIFFDSNRINNKDLLPLVSNGATPPSSHYIEEFELAADALDRYAQWMRGLNNHPTCDNVVQTGQMAIQSLNINQALWRLGYWLGLTEDRVKQFQLELRSKTNNSP
jgi:hypothetical protein